MQCAYSFELGEATIYTEAVISVLKRKYGGTVSSRVWSERLCAASF
jgi:hypothetical protein